MFIDSVYIEIVLAFPEREKIVPQNQYAAITKRFMIMSVIKTFINYL